MPVDKQAEAQYDGAIGKKGRALATDEKERLTFGRERSSPGKGSRGSSVCRRLEVVIIAPAERLFFVCVRPASLPPRWEGVIFDGKTDIGCKRYS